MKFWNKAVAALLAAALCIPAAGCSGTDKSWAVKDASESVPVGAYIFNLYSAYAQADQKKTDSSKDVLSQKIENKDAATWIRAKALTSTRVILLLDQKMKQMNLTLTDAEKKSAADMNSQAWSSVSSSMEKFGVAQSSFELAYGTSFEKERKVFDATYGKGGKQAVSDADLKEYYTKNYTDFSFIACPLYKAKSDGSFDSAFTDAQKKAAESVINNYLTQIKAGKMTIQKAADNYKTVQKSSTDQLHKDSVELASDTNYPAEMKTALKDMKAGEVKAVELKSAQMYVLLSKEDTAKSADSKIATASDRENLLLTAKSSEFLAQLDKEADALTVSVNDKALNSYDPKMFASASSGAS